jgi:uncharacterized protein YggE
LGEAAFGERGTQRKIGKARSRGTGGAAWASNGAMIKKAAVAAAALAMPMVALAGCGASHPTAATVLKATPVSSSSPAPNGGITAHGTGRVSGAPDVMIMSVGVETKATHATEALNQNSSLTTAVIHSLKDHGVADKDIQTAQLSLYPQYDTSGHTVTGYQVTDSVTAKVRDLTKAGATIDAALGAAGDSGRMHGVSFSFDDNSQLLAQARQDAVARAIAQAGQLAGAAGVKLGNLRSLSEDSSQPPAVFNATPTAGGAPSSPIQPGTQDLTVQVTGVWDVV